MNPMSIAALAIKCKALFLERVSADADERVHVAIDVARILETQNARFNLWANNIGVFAGGNASLDARLQDHEDIKTLVVGQLILLLHHLRKIAHHNDSDGDCEAILTAENGYDDEETSSSALSMSSFSTMSSSAAFIPQRSRGINAGHSEIREDPPLAAMIHAINRLHRIAMAIREHSMVSHETKAAKEQFYDEDGRDVVEVFRKWCHEVLRHKFKTSDEMILDRIAYSNSERRRRFLYRKKHQTKLTGRAGNILGTNEESVTGSKVGRARHMPSNANEHHKPAFKQSRDPIVHGSATKLSETTASKFVRESYNRHSFAQSTMVSWAPSTQLRFDFTMYPLAPKVLSGATEFYCPYCCRVHIAAERSGKGWRQHFLADLSPFVCLETNCSTPNRVYPDQQTWLKHMELHNIKYTCHHHSAPVQFSSETDFDEHILTVHCTFPPSRLSTLRSINASSSRLDIDACPICGFTPRLVVPGQSAAHHDQAYKELTTHIANDLHYIAMWSLDEGNDADFDIASNASEIRTIDEGAHSTDMTFSSLSHDIKDVTHDWKEEYYSQEISDARTPDDEALNMGDEWFLMYQKRFPYSGHEQDPKLENFVRRLQLEKLLEEDKLADPQLPCYFLPFKMSKDFYGRHRELERLEMSLHPARATKNLCIMALTGPAGIGKTKLAVQYCQKFQNQYDAVLWAHADEESKLANDFVEMAIQLGFIGRDLPESRDHEHCRQLVKAWFANPLKVPTDPDSPETARWLLVFDHVIDSELVKDYWPTNCKSGSILITSRKPMPWSTTYVSILELQPFEPIDSAAFLSRLLKIDGTGGETLKLGSRAFHSPTQLIFLERMIALKRYSLEAFVRASQDDDGKKVILVLHTKDAMTNQTDFSEWALESLSPMAAALLDVMALLDPDRIIERMLMLPPDSISVATYPKTVEEYSEARAELSSFSLISRGRFTGNLNIHRLIQDAARRNMSEQYYQHVFHTCIALISDQWPYQPFTWRHGIGRWAKCDDLYPHIVRLQHFSSRIDMFEIDIERPYEFAKLATDVAWYCHERGRLTESEGFCEAAIEICLELRDILKEDPDRSKVLNLAQIDRTIGEIYHNHGCISAEINQPEKALQYQLIFNHMMLKELKDGPGADMRLGMSFNELGVAYMINDDWVKGQRCFELSAEEMKRVDNFKPYKISLPLVNLAYCHCLNRRYEEAEKLFMEGLADRVEEFGENDRESFITGRFYHGLANVKLGQGLEQASFKYLERARDHYKMTLGRGHHRSADVMVALGQHYARVKYDKDAVDWFNRALDVYGDRSVYAPEKARAFFQRGRLLRILGQAAEAQKDEDNCLALFREIRPDDKRPLHELSDADFDKLIVFWSR
ncbi:putative NB-ARC domain-containing protein [Seiridium cardinale]|uniref:NB-ARC domain-containing protein n=1 Tax=Seiridium cardinale TaxID=138064 RepID=A0ABR2XR03_9PEZI